MSGRWGTNLAAICFLPECLIHVLKGKIINLVKFNFVQKGKSTEKRGVQTSSACALMAEHISTNCNSDTVGPALVQYNSTNGYSITIGPLLA